MITENIYELTALFIYSNIHAASEWGGSLTFGQWHGPHHVSIRLSMTMTLDLLQGWAYSSAATFFY